MRQHQNETVLTHESFFRNEEWETGDTYALFICCSFYIQLHVYLDVFVMKVSDTTQGLSTLEFETGDVSVMINQLRKAEIFSYIF